MNQNIFKAMLQAQLILWCFALLHFVDTRSFVVILYQANLLASFFTTAFAPFVSPCQISVILAMFQTF